MRTRWLLVIGSAVWVTTVVLAAAAGLEASSAVLFAVLGLLMITALVLMLLIHRRLLRIEARAAQPPSALTRTPVQGSVTPPGPKAASELAAAFNRDLKRTFRQIEALHNLYAMVDIEHALPASRGWPASPDLLLLLVDLVDRHRPTLVVECGSGLSTLCLALAMRRFGIGGRVVALEHLAQYAEQTEELLRRHGVDDIATVRTAPLEPVEVGGIQVGWYARDAWEDLEEVGLLFVDGPPSNLSPHSRYPSLPFFAERLAPHAHIVLDDFQRTKERGVVQRWKADFPGRFTLERIPLEKGAALLTFG